MRKTKKNEGRNHEEAITSYFSWYLKIKIL